jgi:putative membrane protein
MYGALQTHYDYYAQHLFLLHRLQHLVLHHLAPFLIAWAAPQAVFAAALPPGLRWRPPGLRTLGRLYRGIQQPAIAGVLFVGLIWLWLSPGLHIYAMLNIPLYNAMNWGMALDGLLFWWMILNMGDPRAAPARYYGTRLLVLGLIMIPQSLIGSYIALSSAEFYDVYALCGRVLPVDADIDQQIGGLLTWIPAAMMSVVGALVLVRRWLALPAGTAARPALDTANERIKL